MFRTIMIDGKEMELSANAATPFRYKQVFHKDILVIFADEKKAQDEGFEAVAELAYIMAKQAEKTDMNKLTYDDFISWLEDFGPMAFIEAADDIIAVYTGTSTSTSTPKEAE